MAEEGDVIIDFGGCYGDTALYFADKVGKKGKVYTFEFIPGNIKVINDNMQLNPLLRDRITIVDKPVWEYSDKITYYKDSGASIMISFEEYEGYEGKTATLSCDDFVLQNNIEKVDFIKTDIEGAEPYALKGALITLQKFKPKLAISIYHNMNDFTGIIKQIDDLKLGYKFYLGHSTINTSETVLFCKV